MISGDRHALAKAPSTANRNIFYIVVLVLIAAAALTTTLLALRFHT
jgi:hypothetical protein